MGQASQTDIFFGTFPLGLHVGDQLLHRLHHPVSLDQPFGAQREIDQAENLVFIETVIIYALIVAILIIFVL